MAVRTLFLFIFVCFGFQPLFSVEQQSVSKADSVLLQTDSAAVDTANLSQQIVVAAEHLLESVFPSDPELSNADSIIRVFDNRPSFGIYKNNYAIVGTSLNGNMNKYNSDGKIQLSVSHRLTNSILPLKTYLFLTYTQLAFWNVFQASLPFGDINFNPTIGIGKALIYKKRLLGAVNIQLEHESNGKDEDFSRSWNKVSFMGFFRFNRSWTFQSKVWIPLVDGKYNKDITEYKGWGLIAGDYNYKNKFNASLMINKRSTRNLSSNITASLSYKMSKNSNQYFFMEYYNGYGENLLDYNQYRHRIRLGFVIKPNFIFIY